jgi:hypothetical protein
MPYSDMINPVGAPPPQQQQLQGYAPMNPSPVPQEGPPTTPQELEQRKSGWAEFMTKLQTDPTMRNAAMMAATTMMRGTGMGENTGELFGRSLQAGVIAHGFGQANQNRLAMEQQKMEQERLLNQAQITQQNAQTAGLDQTRDFAARDRPMDIRTKQQGIDRGDQQHRLGEYTLGASKFEEEKRPEVHKNTQNKLIAEAYKETEHGRFLGRKEQDGVQIDANGNVIPGTGKEPLSAKDIHFKNTVRRAHPRMEGESEADHDVRLAQIELGIGEKSMDSVVTQAAQKIIEFAPEGSPEYIQASQALQAVIARNGQGTKKTGGTSDKAAWAKARDSVPVGQKYTGPDGKSYVRGN